MSSNTQIHVSTKDHFSLQGVLGAAGIELLQGLLERLARVTEGFPEEVRAQFDWERVDACVWRTSIGADRVLLRLENKTAQVVAEGVRRGGEATRRALEQSVRVAAHRKVNQLLGLMITERIGQRLAQKTSQRVSVLAKNLANQRLALRAAATVRV